MEETAQDSSQSQGGSQSQSGPQSQGGSQSQGGPQSQDGSQSQGGPQSQGGSQSQSDSQPHANNNSASTNKFFEALTWTGVDNTPENQGVIAVAEELKRFSLQPSRGSAPYKAYPIAATALLRSMAEQAFKYHLKKVDSVALNKLKSKNRGLDPSLGALLKHYRQNNRYTTLISDKQMQRVFVSLFGNGAAKTSPTEELLNLTMHQPNHVRPNAYVLEGEVSKGLFSIIHYFMNTP